MNHRRGDKAQRVPPEREYVALLDHQAAVGVVDPEKLFHHRKRLRRCNHRSARVTREERRNVRGMVGLHVLYHQIIRFATVQRAIQIRLPCVADVRVHRVHHGNPLVRNQIGIVRHAANAVLSFKQSQVGVVNADRKNVT